MNLTAHQWHESYRRICVIVAAVTMASCHSEQSFKNSEKIGEATESNEERFWDEWLSVHDREIFTAALLDFSENTPEFLAHDLEGKNVLLVGHKTLGKSGFLDASQINGELRSKAWKIPEDAILDLEQRNAKSYSFEHVQFQMENILIEDFSTYPGGRFWWNQVEEKHPKAKASISFWLPGYSKDGNTAVLRFAFGPTPHGANATYLFRFDGERWKLDQRDFAYYA